MVIVKASQDSEAGKMPSQQLLADMGRFNEELVKAGIMQVKSLDEAIAWVKRCPNPHNEDSEIEIRPLFAAEDFGEAFTPELREQEERLREQLERPKAS